MRIAMFTCTYLPHVGGVARSVQRFVEGYRARGHQVLVVAPKYDGQPEREEGVVRLPAIQHFNGSDFAVVLPTTLDPDGAIEQFQPQVIHSHHPFLVGDMAVREAMVQRAPLVFTWHTMYEDYTHYVPIHADILRGFVAELSTGYANLCDWVIAPSHSLEVLLRQRGVEQPIEVIPTGVDPERYGHGDRAGARQRLGIPPDAFLMGHVGRLTQEKNLIFLAQAVGEALRRMPRSHALFVGTGAFRETIAHVMGALGVDARCHMPGALQGQELVDAYHSMDVFAFSSTTETQGMVLVECMAAGCPVVALDAPGARDVVRDGLNGRLVTERRMGPFAEAIGWVAMRSPEERRRLSSAARASAQEFSTDRSVDHALDLYQRAIALDRRPMELEQSAWQVLLRSLQGDWELWANRFHALVKAASGETE